MDLEEPSAASNNTVGYTMPSRLEADFVSPKPIPAPRTSLYRRPRLSSPHTAPRPSRSNTPSPQRTIQITEKPSNPPPRRIPNHNQLASDVPYVVKRSSVHRQDVLQNTPRPVVSQRPPSVQRTTTIPKTNATDIHSLQNARRAFIESEVNKTNQLNPPHKAAGHISTLISDLDQFDPLLTGQLAIDSNSLSGSGSSSSLLGTDVGNRSHSSISVDATDISNYSKNREEEDLLKVWNLDFDTMNLTTRPATNKASPPLPPKPTSPPQTLPQNRHSVQMGMLNDNSAYVPVPYHKSATLPVMSAPIYPPSTANGTPLMTQSYTGPPVTMPKPTILTPRRPSSMVSALVTNNNNKVHEYKPHSVSTCPHPTALTHRKTFSTDGITDTTEVDRRSQWETFN